jgi:ABC-type Fe3+/spermidine/putrescine transport system ATPase subunit
MIELKNIRYSSDNNFSLNIETLFIPQKSTTCIVGPSGSGKSTLLKIMTGLENFDSGTVKIDGQDVKHLAKKDLLHQLNIMFMSQELGLWPHMSALEHIEFVLETESVHEAEDWLKKVKLDNRKLYKPWQLSGGERQRLALARALAVKPKYLFLDEPFANLDSVLANELLDIIYHEKQKRQFTLVKISHHTVGLNKANINILILDNGTIVQQGNLQEIVDNPLGIWSRKWVSLLTKKV